MSESGVDQQEESVKTFEDLVREIGVIDDEEEIVKLSQELPQQKKESYVRDEFTKLLILFGIDFAQILKLQDLLSVEDKIRYLRFSRCILMEGLSAFSRYDEEMLEVFDKDHSIDSVRILVLRHRISNASKEWIESFREAGGFQVLIENIDNCLAEERNETTGKALGELMACVHHIVGIVTNPIRLIVVETRGALTKFVMSLDFRYRNKQLTMKVLDVLNLIMVPFKDDVVDPQQELVRNEIMLSASEELLAAIEFQARSSPSSNRKTPLPMDFFTKCMKENDYCLKLSVLTFLNNWMKMCSSKVGLRIRIRLLLERAGFSNCLRQFMTGVRSELISGSGKGSYGRDSARLVVSGTYSPKLAQQPEIAEFGGACYLAMEGSLKESLATLSTVNHVWVHIDSSDITVWLLPDSHADTAPSKPTTTPVLSRRLSNVKRLCTFVTNAEVQVNCQHSFRLDLYDGCTLNVGFGSAAECDDWKVKLQNVISASQSERWVWSPPEKQLEVAGAEISFYQAVKFYELCLGIDNALLKDDLDGTSSLNLSNADLFTVIEWQIESHRPGSRKDLEALLRLSARNSFSSAAISSGTEPIPDSGREEENTQIIDARNEEIIRLTAELREAKAKLYEASRFQKADTITSVFLRRGLSKLKHRFLRVANAMRREIAAGNAMKILKSYKRPCEVDRASKYLELGRFARFQGLKENIRTQMFLENFSKEEIDNFFVKDVDM
jgi:hypothetical protein